MIHLHSIIHETRRVASSDEVLRTTDHILLIILATTRLVPKLSLLLLTLLSLDSTKWMLKGLLVWARSKLSIIIVVSIVHNLLVTINV